MEKTIGERIKELRKRENLKLIEIEKNIGISNAALSKIETGKNEPKASTIKALCRYFKVSADYLLFGENAPDQTVDERFYYLNADERDQIEYLLERAKKRHEEEQGYEKAGNL